MMRTKRNLAASPRATPLRGGDARLSFVALFSGFLAMASPSAPAIGPSEPPTSSIDLSGEWAFALDRAGAGTGEEWFRRDLAGRIRLPGSLQEQGFGDRPSRQSPWTTRIGVRLMGDPRFAEYLESEENFRHPFWLTPRRVYVGPAWYQRRVRMPREWAGRRVTLLLERPHWVTTVWLDAERIGSRDSLGTPHQYDLTAAARPGTEQRITIRVDNRYAIPVGRDAHSVSDQTQSNWNGIAGALRLASTPLVWIERAEVYPDEPRGRVEVRVRIGNRSGASGRGTLRARARAAGAGEAEAGPASERAVAWTPGGAELTLSVDAGEGAREWSEHHPALHRLELELRGDGFSASREETFGLRRLGIDGKQFTINGRKIFLRGTLECCIFPLHGYPPAEAAEWKRIFSIARSFGLNHFRFHSWCPPEAAFRAADELGFYLQVEASCWAGFGDGTPVDRWVGEEIERMIRAYGNHPSWILLAPSNEPHGARSRRFLGDLLLRLKHRDPRRCYTAGSGWPRIPENDYEVQARTRLQVWPSLKFDQPPQSRDDYRSYVESISIPTVSHEIGQWCVYPDLGEDRQYTGVLRARNIEIFRDKLQRAGMGDLAADFLRASGRFQVKLYKQEIETALRTPGFAGFQLLDLHDFPGQGTAPVGVLNAFWREKGYVSAREYSRFCGEVVPLLRLAKRVFTRGEKAAGVLDVANYSEEDLDAAVVGFRVTTSGGAVLEEGELAPRKIPAGGLTRVGEIPLPLEKAPAPVRLNVEASIRPTDRANDWDLWVYPESVPVDPGGGLLVASRLGEKVVRGLRAGAKVLLVPAPHTVAGGTLGTFRPIFWNRITFPAQKVHTLGFLCRPSHPALERFPTRFHADWQWEDLLDRSQPIALDALPRELEPVVQPIDDWNDCRRLGLLFEARVAGGRLLVCSIDIERDLERRPVARQLRHSLLEYMKGPRFRPSVELSLEALRGLFRRPSRLQALGATASADSHQRGFGPQRAIDDDPSTIWHTSWTPLEAQPHWITIDLKRAVPIAGLACLPRQDMTNGRIGEWEVRVSLDGTRWGDPVAAGCWRDGSQRKMIRFATPVSARYVRLTSRREVKGQPFASLAEIDILEP